jgi:hypothetical protein
VPPGFEPGNAGFAIQSVCHFATAPNVSYRGNLPPVSSASTAVRTSVNYGIVRVRSRGKFIGGLIGLADDVAQARFDVDIAVFAKSGRCQTAQAGDGNLEKRGLGARC